MQGLDMLPVETSVLSHGPHRALGLVLLQTRRSCLISLPLGGGWALRRVSLTWHGHLAVHLGFSILVPPRLHWLHLSAAPQVTCLTSASASPARSTPGSSEWTLLSFLLMSESPLDKLVTLEDFVWFCFVFWLHGSHTHSLPNF